MSNLFTIGARSASARMNSIASMAVMAGLLLQLFVGVFLAPSLASAQDFQTQEEVSQVVSLDSDATQNSQSNEVLNPETAPLGVLSSVFVETEEDLQASSKAETEISAGFSFSSSGHFDDCSDTKCMDEYERVELKNLPVPANSCVPDDDTGGIVLSAGEMVWHFVLTNSKTDHLATLHVSFGDTDFIVLPTTVNNGVQHFYLKTASGATLTEAYVTGAVAKHGKKMTLQLSHCTFGPDLPPPPALATIVATKIVCENEADLPNWGAGGPDITEHTAAQFLSTHPNCRPESGWKFQSAPAGTANPGDTLVGEAPAPWNTSPLTDATGKTTWTVPAQGERIWVREVLKDGYLPFTFGVNGGTNADPVSAEMYCHTDVLNYDNYDFIASPQGGATYYCVAFNTPKTSSDPSACPFTASEDTYVIQYGTAKKIVSNSTHSAASVTKAVSIPAGTYEVSLYSYDSYPSRDSVSQPREEWYLRLSDSAGLVAASGAISDLADYVDTAIKSEYVGDVTLSRPVTGAMAKHAAWPDNTSANSLYPICAQLRLKKETPNSPPVITVTPPNPMSITIGTTFTDPGATAFDVEDGDITANIVSTGVVDTSTVGTYTITYTVSDSKGLPAEPKTRTVTVISQCSDGQDNDGDGKADAADSGCPNPNDDDENTPPSITLVGSDPMTIIQGTVFTDPGAIANDEEDGMFPATASGLVDSSTLGSYVITYAAVDSDGAAATPVLRTVNVVPASPTYECSDGEDNDGDGKTDYPEDAGCESAADDDENDRPIITVTPPNPSIITIGTTFTDPGATAFDVEDGDITANIVSTGVVDTSTVGTYTITYTVSDSKGLPAEPKTRTVTVISQCSDGQDNDGDGKVDYPEDAGCEHPNDDSENARPVITVLGDNPMTIVVGTTFTDPGATATDLEDGTIPVTFGGAVDTAVIGTYTITYSAQDSQGLAAEPKTRTVNVIPSSGCTVNCGGGSTPPACSNGGDDDGDGLADYPADPGCSSSNDNDERDGGPTLTLLGENPLTITLGTTFTDPGATAFDPEDGDITSRIVVSGAVDTSLIGSYTLTYTVTDTAGNAATPAVRTVNVVAGGGGGGGGGSVSLVITDERIQATGVPGEVQISWNTNLAATSRVVYGVSSVAIPEEAPLYGYATSNATDTTLVYTHAMIISGLVEGVRYYFRPVSTEGSQTAVGIELVFDQGAPASCHYLKEYLRYGAANNPEEVVKLQSFLKDFEGFSNLAVTGFFDLSTDAAVRAFQDKYAADVLAPWNLPGNTGYVYYTTQKKINEIYCQRAFPLNEAQLAEIEAFKRLLEALERESEASDRGVLPVVGSTGGSVSVGSGLAAGNAGTNVGEVAGAATGEGKMTNVGDDDSRPGAIERGRIALADLLATVPNLGEKLRETGNRATVTDETSAELGEQASGTSRVAAAVGAIKSVSGCTWLAWILFLVILVLLVMYMRLWLRHRAEEEQSTSQKTQ